MKKVLLLVALAVSAFAGTASAQSYFNENFEAGSLPTNWDTSYSSSASAVWQFIGTPYAGANSSFNPAAHTKIAILNDDAAQSYATNPAWLTTGDISLPAGSHPMLTFDSYYFGGTYQSKTEVATVNVSTDGGATWTLVDTLSASGSWFTQYMPLTAYAGQTIRVGFKYSDGTGWLYGVALDNVSIAEGANDNATIYAPATTLKNQYFKTTDNLDISGFIRNVGLSNITAATFSYKIDNGAVTSITSNPASSVAPGSFSAFTLNTISVGSVGAHTITLWNATTNGNAETDHNGDSISFKYMVAASLQHRHKAFFEHFTQASCPPCAQINPILSPILQDREDVQNNMAVVKYQTSWPGTDPMNAQNPTDVATRVTYYGVSGVPNSVLNGNVYNGHPATILNGNYNQMFDDAYNQNSPMVVTLTNVTYNSNTVSGTATVTLNSQLLPGANVVARCAIIEKNIYYSSAPGTNGEKTFQNVMRKMAPGAQGVPVTLTTAGQTQTINFSWNQANASNIKNPSEVRMVVWLQDDNNQAVYDANLTSQLNLGVVGADLYDGLELSQNYPNPAAENTFIRYSNVKNNMTLRITDMMGRVVSTQNVPAGSGMMDIETANLANGIYSYTLYSADQMVATKQMTVAH